MLRVQRTPVTIAPTVAGLLVSGIYDLQRILLVALAIFFLHVSAGALNDVADYEADKINAPDRPIVRGIISRKQALYLAISLFLCGLLIFFTIDIILFVLAISLGFSLELIYNFGPKLKNHAIGSLLFLSSSVSMTPFLIGCLAARNLTYETVQLSLFLLAISSGVAVGSLKDFHGDKLAGKRTLAVALGPKRASRVISALFLLPALLYPFPVVLFNFSEAYFIYIIPALSLRLTLAYLVLNDYSTGKARKYIIGWRILLLLDIAALVLSHFG
jgi:geranylgeranylglycerol-phosphate geranylgeranyltransferase